ncbi:hypothetical protein IGI04_019767 [Brassica rapa subsp. trilocularis]|nr:hypothetical protein IGI04_019767 [Brassica rapa subsp. trilocularis]
MANPHEPHFFKPLLPGFHSGVTIPLGFFSKHIEGNTNQKTWKLRSDASDQTWEVIQEGRTLTGGWKDFTTAHDLQIGDVVIFKHEGDIVFHVTPFGPSCCEIQYTHPHIIKEEADAGDADDNEIRGTWAMSSFSFDYCFLAEVTASNLKADKLYLPKGATSSTALNKQCQEMILVNKEGNSWTVSLRFSESGGMYYITRGWGKFCHGKTTPLLCVCPESKECSELLSKHLSRKRGESSPLTCLRRDIASDSRITCTSKSKSIEGSKGGHGLSFIGFLIQKKMKNGSLSLNRAVGESPHETSSSHVEKSYWLLRCALSTGNGEETRESPHFLLSPKKLGFATREAIVVATPTILVATPIQSKIVHQIDAKACFWFDIGVVCIILMDPAEERRHSKKQKDHCDMLGFVADSQYGVPRKCACGGRIIDEVRGKEDYDSLPGKRFFTCVNYEDDGLHYRHPWVVAVQEEIKTLSTRLDEAEEVVKGVWKLNKRIKDLEEQVSTLSEQVDDLTVEVGTLEKVMPEEEVRPAGVKAAKASKRKRHGNEAAFDQIESILAARKKISQQKLLDRLLAKNETDLSPNEISLKNKLVTGSSCLDHGLLCLMLLGCCFFFSTDAVYYFVSLYTATML